MWQNNHADIRRVAAGKPRLANAFIVVGRGASSKLGDSSIQGSHGHPSQGLILLVTAQNNPDLLCLLLDDKEKGDIFISLDVVTTAPVFWRGPNLLSTHGLAPHFCGGRTEVTLLLFFMVPPPSQQPDTPQHHLCVLGDRLSSHSRSQGS